MRTACVLILALCSLGLNAEVGGYTPVISTQTSPQEGGCSHESGQDL